MSSDLLANALARERQVDAAAIQPSDLLRTLASRKVDLVVINADLGPKSENAFELANAVTRGFPSIYLVMLLNQTSNELVVNAFRCGAHGVFSRQQSIAEFLDCIEHVGRGFLWAGKDAADALLDAFRSVPAPRSFLGNDSPGLTERELQVIECAARGKTNKSIAKELRLSEHTVKNYLFRAFEKIGVSSRMELLFYLTTRGYTFQTSKDDAQDAASGIAAFDHENTDLSRVP